MLRLCRESVAFQTDMNCIFRPGNSVLAATRALSLSFAALCRPVERCPNDWEAGKARRTDVVSRTPHRIAYRRCWPPAAGSLSAVLQQIECIVQRSSPPQPERAPLRLMVLKEFVERPLIMYAVRRAADLPGFSTYHLAGRSACWGAAAAGLPALDVSRPAFFVPAAAG